MLPDREIKNPSVEGSYIYFFTDLRGDLTALFLAAGLAALAAGLSMALPAGLEADFTADFPDSLAVVFSAGGLAKNKSRAATILGLWGLGTCICSSKPASTTALEVLFPKAVNMVPFCLKSGKLSKRLFTPLGVNKQI